MNGARVPRGRGAADRGRRRADVPTSASSMLDTLGAAADGMHERGSPPRSSCGRDHAMRRCWRCSSQLVMIDTPANETDPHPDDARGVVAGTAERGGASVESVDAEGSRGAARDLVGGVQARRPRLILAHIDTVRPVGEAQRRPVHAGRRPHHRARRVRHQGGPRRPGAPCRHGAKTSRPRIRRFRRHRPAARHQRRGDGQPEIPRDHRARGPPLRCERVVEPSSEGRRPEDCLQGDRDVRAAGARPGRPCRGRAREGR